jgi:hypothetical protein
LVVGTVSRLFLCRSRVKWGYLCVSYIGSEHINQRVHSHLDHHGSTHAIQVTCHICSLSPLSPLHNCWSSPSTLRLPSPQMCFWELGNLLGPVCLPFITHRSNATAFLYSSTAEIQGCANGHEQHALVHHPIPHKCMSLSSSAPLPFYFCFPTSTFLYIYLISLLLQMEAGVSRVPPTSQCILTNLLFLPC